MLKITCPLSVKKIKSTPVLPELAKSTTCPIHKTRTKNKICILGLSKVPLLVKWEGSWVNEHGQHPINTTAFKGEAQKQNHEELDPKSTISHIGGKGGIKARLKLNCVDTQQNGVVKHVKSANRKRK